VSLWIGHGPRRAIAAMWPLVPYPLCCSKLNSGHCSWYSRMSLSRVTCSARFGGPRTGWSTSIRTGRARCKLWRRSTQRRAHARVQGGSVHFCKERRCGDGEFGSIAANDSLGVAWHPWGYLGPKYVRRGCHLIIAAPTHPPTHHPLPLPARLGPSSIGGSPCSRQSEQTLCRAI
jgi:hypothetical protein